VVVNERPDDRGRLVGWAAAIGVFSILAYLVRFTAEGQDTTSEPLYLWSSAVAGVIQFGIFVGLVLLLARGRPLLEYLAIRRPTSWGVSARICGLLLVGVWLIGLLTRPFIDPGAEQGLVPTEWEPSRAAPFAANFIVVAVLGPVVEEVVFRGLGYTLLEPFGRRLAIVGSAFAWALSHGLVEGFAIIFVFGLGLGYLRGRVNSIVPGMILHIFFNSLVLLIAVRLFT
jgi:membrane protease YdiL (CAAX protease family)